MTEKDPPYYPEQNAPGQDGLYHVETSGAPAQTWTRWAIAFAASLGAVLEVLDTSIVNVALPDMQGNLGATLSEIGWVITGYAVANVIIIPLSAWLGDYFGKKAYFIFSLIGFTLASVMCGLSTTLPMLIAARILQGLAGGGLLAKAQSILFETFPKEEQAKAQAVFGIGVIVGPAIGPTLGGYLTDTFNWRWIFFINIPFGILAVMMAALFFPKNTPNPNISRRVDWLGIGLLTVGLASLQTLLEQGQEKDWFASPLISLMGVFSLIGLCLFIWRELSIDHPAVNLRILRYRSLSAGSVYSMVLGMGLYGTLFAVPIFAQNILHFTAQQTGMLLFPGALASAVMMPIAGKLMSKLDVRLLIAGGAVIIALVAWSLGGINPQTSEESLFWPLIWRGIGTVLMYMPLTMAAIGSIPKQDIPSATGFFNLTRQLGGSIGIAFLATMLSQREQFHRSLLVERVNDFNPAANQQLGLFSQMMENRGADPISAHQQALTIIDRSINLQASILSFSDVFWIVGIIFIASLVLLLFLKRGKNRETGGMVH